MRLYPGATFGLAVCSLLALGCGSAHDAGASDEDGKDRDRPSDEGKSRRDAAVAGEDGTADGGGEDPAPDAATADPQPQRTPEGLLADPQDPVFAQNTLRHYEIEVDPDQWAYINETAYLEQYIEGRLTVDGETLAPIGVRFKGFRGSLYNCFDFDDQGNSLGRTCRRLSLKVAFDEYDDTRRFHGLKKLNFHAMRNDSSLMRERLGYWLFRAFGVPAPRAVHATLTVNGENLGLFALVEDIDGTFARARFPDGGKGNIYNERWPTSSADPAYFRSGLQSNRNDPDLDLSPMVRFAEAVMGATDETIEAVLREHTDFDVLMRYLAVDRAIDHWDGPTAFRCQPVTDVPPLPPEVFEAQTPPLGWETCQNKNFYWYQDEDDGRLWLTAWDMDFTFSAFSQFPDWNTAPSSCEVEQSGRPPRCDKLIDWFATVLRPHYARAGQELLAGPFEPELLRAMADGWYQQILPHVDPASVTLGALLLAASIDDHHAEFQRDVMRSVVPPPAQPQP
jgi:spore coat protein H